MPLAIDDEALGHARRAERDLHLLCGSLADPLIRDRRCGRGKRRRPRAGRGPRSRRSRTPSRLQLAAAPWHFGDARHAPAGEDVEQARLAGREVARAERRLGRQRPAAARTPASACPSSLRCDRRVGRRRQPPDQAATSTTAAARAARSGRRGSCVALPAPFGRAPCAGAAATDAPSSASAPPSAISAPPSQIRVTNGFHHSRSCQPPDGVGLADDGVELAVPEGLDRRFVGLGRRIGEIARLRLQRDRARRPRVARSSRFDRRPVLARRSA